jgi:myo-inositol-1(or 4)-monophosphatase
MVIGSVQPSNRVVFPPGSERIGELFCLEDPKVSATPTPLAILETLLPHLRVAAHYAQQIQATIAILPEKEKSHNAFAAALTDADLSIQTMIEVALLGSFPALHFYGEEYEQSRNTKYLRSQSLSPEGNYLVTLDPIDGTRFYMDKHPNYQILLGVLGWDEFEAAIAITPAKNHYMYAVRGQGLCQGQLDQALETCTPVSVTTPPPTILLGSGMDRFKAHLPDTYSIVSVEVDYSTEHTIPNVNGILTGDLAGAVLRGGKFIDGALLAFLATEMGCIVTTHDGQPLPPLHACQDYARPGLAIATSPAVHRDLLQALSLTE